MNQQLIMNELNHVLSTPWAIDPHYLDCLSSSFRIMNDPKASFFVEEEPPDLNNVYYIENVAVISITGPVVKRESWITRWYGYHSCDRLRETIQELVNSKAVSAIVLDLDCPGGQVPGTADLADHIYESRGTKPIIAVANEMMTSAGYWFGSACDEIVVNKTGIVGSIGVYSLHRDFSQWEKDYGIKTTIFKAGRFKAAGHPSMPVDDLTREVFQKNVDYIYSQFVGSVAKYRNRAPEEIHKEIGDARCFRGEKAVEVGAADRVASLDEVIQELVESSASSQPYHGGTKYGQTDGPETNSANGQYARRIERRVR